MGSGLIVKCEKCSYRYESFTGVGYMFVKVYDDTVKEIRRGKYGKEYKKFFKEHENAVVDCSFVTALCLGCGRLERLKNMTLYLPSSPKTDGNGYVMFDEVTKGFKKCMEYDHKCSSCGESLKFIDLPEEIVKGTVKCPDCGGKLKAGEFLNWD